MGSVTNIYMFSFFEFIVLTTCCERTEVTCYSMNVDTHSINALSDLKKTHFNNYTKLIHKNHLDSFYFLFYLKLDIIRLESTTLSCDY